MDSPLGLFPPGAAVDPSGQLVVGGCGLRDLADRYGTPLYVVDEGSLRSRVARFRTALADRWPNSKVLFASKAFPCRAVERVMVDEGIGVDVAGGGELAIALAAGVPPSDIVLHGNAKTRAELQMAVDAGVGTVVVDNHDDIDRLEQVVRERQHVSYWCASCLGCAPTPTTQSPLVRSAPNLACRSQRPAWRSLGCGSATSSF